MSGKFCLSCGESGTYVPADAAAGDIKEINSELCDVCGNRCKHDATPHPIIISGDNQRHRSSGLIYSAVNTAEDMSQKTSSIVQPDENRSKSALATVLILFFVNLLNYMDRFTIAGVLPEVQTFYNIDHTEAGLLQTSFVCSFMILAPIFGYLGDRYNRKYIMAAGILFWSLTTLIGSFIPAGYFWWFLFFRGLVGIGEASYSTIAPTIIADMYKGTMRSRMLAFFYFAIPVGSGMGYMVGSNVAKAFQSWHWALRVTPVFGIICVLLLIFVLKEPPRGESEGGHDLAPTLWKEDMISLLHNPSFIWSTFGFTAVAFVAGALAWWGPSFLLYAVKVQKQTTDLGTISLVFGVITVVAGIIGVTAGSLAAQMLKKHDMTADPLVCAFGMITSMPFLFFGAIVAEHYTAAAYTLIFFGEVFLCLNWALVADILLYVVVPTRRSSAEAFQILLSHALGDAGSPYIIGTIADAIGDGKSPTNFMAFHSMQCALFTTCFVSVLGGLCFIICSWYIIDDKKKADDIIRGKCLTNSLESVSDGIFF
uniref:Major facilitator superfamily (MFS) profile domain-containing protein n=1 Tax=Strigamia maritima TaxID=126957 RepID=T1J6E4_STRMM